MIEFLFLENTFLSWMRRFITTQFIAVFKRLIRIFCVLYHLELKIPFLTNFQKDLFLEMMLNSNQIGNPNKQNAFGVFKVYAFIYHPIMCLTISICVYFFLQFETFLLQRYFFLKLSLGKEIWIWHNVGFWENFSINWMTCELILKF